MSIWELFCVSEFVGEVMAKFSPTSVNLFLCIIFHPTSVVCVQIISRRCLEVHLAELLPSDCACSISTYGAGESPSL